MSTVVLVFNRSLVRSAYKIHGYIIGIKDPIDSSSVFVFELGS